MLAIQPTHVSHPTIDALVSAMRAAGRLELVHYAGACWRDDDAWRVCCAWVASPSRTEAAILAWVRNAN